MHNLVLYIYFNPCHVTISTANNCEKSTFPAVQFHNLHWVPIFTIFRISYLDDDAALIIAESDVIGSLHVSYGPDPLHAIVESGLQPVGVGMPDPHRTCHKSNKTHE